MMLFVVVSIVHKTRMSSQQCKRTVIGKSNSVDDEDSDVDVDDDDDDEGVDKQTPAVSKQNNREKIAGGNDDNRKKDPRITKW